MTYDSLRTTHCFQRLYGVEEVGQIYSILQVSCVVEGFPRLEVNQTRDGKLPDTTNKLTIKQVTYEDAGQYTCTAKNSK